MRIRVGSFRKQTLLTKTSAFLSILSLSLDSFPSFPCLTIISSYGKYDSVPLGTPLGESFDADKLCKTVRQKRLSSLAANSETSYRDWQPAKGLSFSREMCDKLSALRMSRE
jgi:hypothetical protein